MPTIAKDQRKSANWATIPIKGGPIKNPMKLIEETAANAIPADIVVDFPAAL